MSFWDGNFQVLGGIKRVSFVYFVKYFLTHTHISSAYLIISVHKLTSLFNKNYHVLVIVVKKKMHLLFTFLLFLWFISREIFWDDSSLLCQLIWSSMTFFFCTLIFFFTGWGYLLWFIYSLLYPYHQISHYRVPQKTYWNKGNSIDLVSCFFFGTPCI